MAPKTYAVIRNKQLNGIRPSAELYLYMPRATMFCDIAQRFLDNTIEAQGYGFLQINSRILHGALNLHLSNFREFLAQSSYRCRQSEQAQFGRVQLVAEVLNIRRDFSSLLPKVSKLVSLHGFVRVQVALKFLKAIGQKSQSLIDVVVQFSCNSGSFLLLGMEQSATQLPLDDFRFLLFGDIDTTAHVTSKPTVLQKAGNATMHYPTIASVVASQAKFDSKLSFGIECEGVGTHTTLSVFRMDVLHPTHTEFLFRSSPSKS